jgi:proteic killer suppression protein
VIRSFRDKDTEAIWQRRYVKKLSPELSRLTYNKLVLVNAAEIINDLRVPPGNRLEKLVGSRAGQYSIPVNDQWRICFTGSVSGGRERRTCRLPLGRRDRWQTSRPPTPARSS